MEMPENDQALAPSSRLSLAADYYNRYPGELVTLYTRFVIPGKPNATVQISLPRVMIIESYGLPAEIPHSTPVILEEPDEIIFVLPLGEHFIPGQEYQATLNVRVKTFYLDQLLLVEAKLYENSTHTQPTVSETIQIAVFGKGKYLQYLPEIYESDDFLGRFLMLFESFWKPITQQINQMECYFDPSLTTQEFVPWLASWVGLPVDPSLPGDRIRSLLKSAMMFYQLRGTAQALTSYLEIYTDGDVTVLERRARNFVLGIESELGVDIALGNDNQPNSLLITIQIPEVELGKMKYSKEMYHQKMMEIVRTMVPAHTFFNVNCEFVANKLSD